MHPQNVAAGSVALHQARFAEPTDCTRRRYRTCSGTSTVRTPQSLLHSAGAREARGEHHIADVSQSSHVQQQSLKAESESCSTVQTLVAPVMWSDSHRMRASSDPRDQTRFAKLAGAAHRRVAPTHTAAGRSTMSTPSPLRRLAVCSTAGRSHPRAQSRPRARRSQAPSGQRLSALSAAVQVPQPSAAKKSRKERRRSEHVIFMRQSSQDDGSKQWALGSMQTCNRQHAQCSLRRATCKGQCATCTMRRCNLQRTTIQRSLKEDSSGRWDAHGQVALKNTGCGTSRSNESVVRPSPVRLA
jgi:hypothetical protein